VTRICRIAFVAPILLACLLNSPLPAQQKKKKPGDDDGMTLPPVITDDKKKKKKEETQTLPPAVEPPSAVVVDTDRISFQVSPLSNKGLLSQQTRDALKTMLRTNRGVTIVKLRAFVAGSGDLRRIGEIVAEVFTEKHQALPALSVIQAGALPMVGAQVVLESTALEKRPVNPNGLGFLSGQAAPSVGQSLDKLKSALRSAGLEAADVLRATCFVSSLDDPAAIGSAISASFPSAAINYVQMQREPVNPASECEAVARLHAGSTADVRFVNPPELDRSPNYSQVVLVTSPKLVITGTQLAFGAQENDIRLAFERLRRALAQFKAGFERIAMSHVYLTSTTMTEKVRAVRATFYNTTTPPASTLLPFEGLPSLDATFGVDVIAVPAEATASRPRH
jgi:enamine deaminase RidA (YjgF/YER057c/UK114 family)